MNEADFKVEYNKKLMEQLEKVDKLVQNNYKNLNYYYKSSIQEEIKNNKYLKKKRSFKIEYKPEFQNGGILIDQKNRNGKTLDQAFLYGNKDEKILIGLQMKFYGEDTSISLDE